MSREATARPDISRWRGNLLRMTTFHSYRDLEDVQKFADLWQQSTGDEPETSITKPKTKELVIGGPRAGALLGMHVQARLERVDWVLAGAQTAEEARGPSASLGARIDNFCILMNTWLKW